MITTISWLYGMAYLHFSLREFFFYLYNLWPFLFLCTVLRWNFYSNFWGQTDHHPIRFLWMLFLSVDCGTPPFAVPQLSSRISGGRAVTAETIAWHVILRENKQVRQSHPTLPLPPKKKIFTIVSFFHNQFHDKNLTPMNNHTMYNDFWMMMMMICLYRIKPSVEGLWSRIDGWSRRPTALPTTPASSTSRSTRPT